LFDIGGIIDDKKGLKIPKA